MCRNRCTLQGTCRTSRLGAASSANVYHTQHVAVLAAFLPFLARGAFLARAAYLLVLTLHTRLVINPNALCRLACASLWKPCAKHGHGGLQSRSGCARNAVCRNVSYSAVDALGCCQLVARSWESWVHWACLLMLQQIWWRGLRVCSGWLCACVLWCFLEVTCTKHRDWRYFCKAPARKATFCICFL